MKKNAKQILLVVVLVSMLGSLKVYAQAEAQPVQELTAWDSAGRRIGNVQGGFLAAVAFAKDNTTFLLFVLKSRFQGTWGQLFFNTLDCTGAAYFDAANVSDFPMTPTAIRDGKIYIPNPSPPVPVTVKSFFTEGGQGCVAEEFGANIIPAKVLGNVPSFTPPFSVR